MRVSIGMNAAGKGLTIGELADVIEKARRAGIPDDAVPTVISRFSGAIKRITAEADVPEPPEGGDTSWLMSPN